MGKGSCMLLLFSLCFGAVLTAVGQVTSYRLYSVNSGIQAATSQSVVLSRFVPFDGRPSIRFTLNKTDKTVQNGKRAEVFFRAENKLPVDRWYAFNIWLPASFVADSLPEIVAQWHATPDFSLGEGYRSPPVSLMMQKGLWRMDLRWATQTVNNNSDLSGRIVYDFGKAVTGRWTQWVFHINFSYKADGLLEVWKDGVSVYARKGPNYYNDKIGPYFKFGIYKWDWMKTQLHTTVDQRILYFGGVKLGGSDASIEDFLHE